MDAVDLARIQFAFTIAYHYLFVPLSLGVALFLVIAERRYYKSGRDEDRAAASFWVKLFTTTFAIGVATGITMEFAFGTNWADYSRFVGDIFGAPLAAEGLFSFFLESTFLGVLLFGRGRVSRRFYYVSAWLVFFGAHLSALWIIIANSWQQTPAGYEVVAGRAVLTDFFAAALNPSTLPRYFHTVTAAWVAGAFYTAGIAAYYLRKGRHVAFSRRVLGTALAVGLVVSLSMPLIGHQHSIQVMDTQPVKMAAYEGQFVSGEADELILWGWVNEQKGTLDAKLAIPGLGGLLTGGRELAGLNEVAAADRPPLQATFQSYHLMVALGVFFIVMMATGLVLKLTGRLESSRRYLRLLTWSIPLPVLASQVGWMAAEVGRQPWIVQGELRTLDAVSPTVPAAQIALTLALFAMIYALLFVAWLRIVLDIVRRGPALSEEPVGRPALEPAPAALAAGAAGVALNQASRR